MKSRIGWTIFVSLWCIALHLKAQFVWTGNGATGQLLSDTGNWQGGVAPGGTSGTENLTFGDIASAPQFNVLVPTSTFHDLTLPAGARPAYNFGGTGASPVLTLNGTVTVGSGTDALFNSTLGLSLASGAHVFDIGTTTTLEIDGAIDGAGSLAKTGSGLLLLTGGSTYVGGTTVNQGTLKIQGGSISQATANVTVGQASGDNANFSIIAGGQLTNQTGTLGNLAGSVGEVDVLGAGSTWTNTTYLYVGALGTGTLLIQSGGSVHAPNVSVGNNTGGVGTLLVDGSGSSLVVAGTLYAGSQGSGNFSVHNGATATSVTGSIANNVGGSGSADVSGAGSSWVNSGSLLVGDAASGQLNIDNGGSVSSADITLGGFSGSDGTLIMQTSGVMSSTGNLTIGNAGNGTVFMKTGAMLTTGGQGILGNNAGTLAHFSLSDPGTTWTSAGDIFVGNSGTGFLTSLNGAITTIGGGTGTLHLGHLAGGEGNLVFGYDGSTYGVAGILDAAMITTEAGTGYLTFGNNNTAATPYYLTRDGTAGGTSVVIAGATQVQSINGYTQLNGANSYTGGTSITGGTLVAGSNSALGTGTVTVNGGVLNVASGVTLANPLSFGASGGTLAGNGTFGTPVTIGANQKLSPGNSPGNLAFSSGLTLAPGGVLTFEVQAAGGVAGTGYDLISVSGAVLDITATSGSPFIVRLNSLNGSGTPGAVADFVSSNAYAWTIFTSSAGITNFAANKFSIDASGFTNSLGVGSFFISQSGNTVLLNFTPVPEPSTFALTFLGLGALALGLRRRSHGGARCP